MGKRRKSEGITEPHVSKREFLTFCGKSLCGICAENSSGFRRSCRHKRPRKGSSRQSSLPISLLLTEEKSSVVCAQGDVVFPRVKGVFAGCAKIGEGSIIAWSMEILVSLIYTRLRKNPFSTCFQAPLL